MYTPERAQKGHIVRVTRTFKTPHGTEVKKGSKGQIIRVNKEEGFIVVEWVLTITCERVTHYWLPNVRVNGWFLDKVK